MLKRSEEFTFHEAAEVLLGLATFAEEDLPCWHELQWVCSQMTSTLREAPPLYLCSMFYSITAIDLHKSGHRANVAPFIWSFKSHNPSWHVQKWHGHLIFMMISWCQFTLRTTAITVTSSRISSSFQATVASFESSCLEEKVSCMKCIGWWQRHFCQFWMFVWHQNSKWWRNPCWLYLSGLRLSAWAL